MLTWSRSWALLFLSSASSSCDFESDPCDGLSGTCCARIIVALDDKPPEPEESL